MSPTAGRLPKHKTCRRYNVPGDAHSLTFSCFQRRRFLSKDRTVLWLIRAIESARRRLGFDVWAYVIMPEHVHLLIMPRSEHCSISRVLAAVKIPVARHAVAHVRRQHPDALDLMRDAQPNGKIAYRFWQRGGGYDRNLVTPRTVHEIIDYIHANPVRRELVTSPDEWHWSSAGYYASSSDVALIPDADSLPPRDFGS